MIERFTVETFAGRVGERFQIDEIDADARLVEVRALGNPPVGGGRAPFALVFRGGSVEAAPQRIYELRHEELGTFPLFLVPIGPENEGMLYEAIFT